MSYAWKPIEPPADHPSQNNNNTLKLPIPCRHPNEDVSSGESRGKCGVSSGRFSDKAAEQFSGLMTPSRQLSGPLTPSQQLSGPLTPSRQYSGLITPSPRKREIQATLSPVTTRMDPSGTIGNVIGDHCIQHTVLVPKRIVHEDVIEKVVVIPEKVRREEIVETLQTFQERIVEVAKPVVNEQIVEVPDVVYVDKVIEVPHILIQERLVNVPKFEIQERIHKIPKIIQHETVVEVPEIEYKDTVVEKTVEVPQIHEQVVVRENVVPRYLVREVPEYVDVQKPYDVEIKIPVPLQSFTRVEYEYPTLIPRMVKYKFPVYLPRFIEVPVARQSLPPESGAQLELAADRIGLLKTMAEPVSLCEIERLATTVAQQLENQKVGDAVASGEAFISALTRTTQKTSDDAKTSIT